MTLVRVHNFAVSLDGFGTGEGQTAEAHFGHAGDRLHEWMFTTGWWQAGGSGGVDDAFIRQHDRGIGAQIMGARKVRGPGWGGGAGRAWQQEGGRARGAGGSGGGGGWGPQPRRSTRRCSC